VSERLRVRFKPEAERDLQEAFEWYQGRRRGLGDEFLLAVEASIQVIERTPLVFPEVHRQIRRGLVRRFPYGIFFVLEGAEVVVLAVFHARRDPSVWKTRT
jgi:plasmid stabilization system protein ParE